jgi:signal peptidase I
LLTNGVDGSLKQELMLDVLRKYGSCRLQVSGTSMLPTLRPGDTVSIESKGLTALKLGDIVLYERCGRFFLHRLVALPAERFPGRLVTRGDSMPQADPAVRVESVLGVLATVRRGENWIAVPGTMPRMTRVAAALLARSGGLVRLALYIASSPALAPNRKRDHDGTPEIVSPSFSRGDALSEVDNS